MIKFGIGQAVRRVEDNASLRARGGMWMISRCPAFAMA